jgi:hypothetical protein
MEAQGILSKPDSTGKRVILTKRDWLFNITCCKI